MAAPEAGAIAGEILERLGLDAAAQSQRACTLSGGQARRAALARALLLITHRPEDLELLEITRQINI